MEESRGRASRLSTKVLRSQGGCGAAEHAAGTRPAHRSIPALPSSGAGSIPPPAPGQPKTSPDSAPCPLGGWIAPGLKPLHKKILCNRDSILGGRE